LRAIRPVEFERLLPDEPPRTAARCRALRVARADDDREAKVYCDVCDEIRPHFCTNTARQACFPADLCAAAVCYASRARLYGTKVSAR